ncbi:hypothetical protein CHS0354_031865 [Potamilus streckersoni]|uniref:Ras-associating domain-containing protein n=1 Tax=Potamilus streckersoni TaxID=2493646 RepID=A0AAE0RXR5_9BIVA|nr:hypothetical protein CHS0354_031865 [Potamilus streckersoni]
MHEADNQKMHSFSVLVEGRNCCLNVTKNTTCGDVIKQLLNYNGMKKMEKNDEDSYFLFASNNITEQQLSNKENILNVAKDLMTETNRVHFIMRKKTRLFLPAILNAKLRRLRDKTFDKEVKVEKVESTPLDTSKHTPSIKSNEQIRGVKRLYQLVQVQTRRLSEVYQKLNGTAKFSKRAMEKEALNPTADTSLDKYINNVNNENMQGFLNFCDVVATKEMENLSSFLPTSPSATRSVIDGHMRLMHSTSDSPHMDYTTENKLVNQTKLPEFNDTLEDITNDVLILDDKQYHRGESEGSFGTMAITPIRRLTIADPSRMRWNEKPLHSTPLANKTMTYLNKSIKPSRMMRQIGSTRLALEPLTNLQLKEIPRFDSSLKRRYDGDLSMIISQRKSSFSSQKDKCKYIREQSYVSNSDVSLDRTLLDKELDDSILDNFDD